MRVWLSRAGVSARSHHESSFGVQWRDHVSERTLMEVVALNRSYGVLLALGARRLLTGGPLPGDEF